MDRKSWSEQKEMPLEELKEYYRTLRKEAYENNDPIKGIELRKKLHGLVKAIIKIEKKLEGFSTEILSDESTKGPRPRVYAVTHVARFDIEAAVEAAKEDAFIMWGDPGELYRSPERIFLEMIGMIFVDTDNKEDRHISLETMVKTLKQGGNIIIFPEGAWNITENEVVMKLFTGVIEGAIRGGADIVPVAVEKDQNNKYYVKVGKNIDTSTMSLENKREEADQLRDVMATLKWGIWEHIEKEQGLGIRKDMPYDASDQFLNSIMKDSDNGYTVEEIERTRYQDRTTTAPDDAFAHLLDINRNENNAFLFENMTDQDRARLGRVLIKRRQNDIL